MNDETLATTARGSTPRRTRHGLQLLLGVIAASLAATSSAIDLAEVYRLALENDQQYLSATAASLAAKEARPQALAGLLPDLSANGNVDRTREDVKGARISYFTTKGYALRLTQPIYRLDRYIALGEANIRVAQADVDLAASRQELMVRVADRYFAVLKAMDTLEFARAEKGANEQQLKQAKQRFEVGLIAITDVQEAQAGFDLAVANEIAAVNDRDTALEALREVTGAYHTDLAALGRTLPLVTPEPPDIDAWTAIALEQNLALQSADQDAKVAQAEIRRIKAGHMPTLDVVGRHQRTDTGGGFFGGRDIEDTSVSLQLAVPIFSGGSVLSRTRQARHLYQKALNDYDAVRRSTQRLTRDAFLGVQSGISRVKALNQALASTQSALEAVEAGFQVGTRTSVDVLDAQRDLFQAKRDYSASRYDYLLNILRLKQAAGTLSEEDIGQVNGWLE